MAIYNPLTGYEPKILDNFDHSETSAMIFQDESGDIDTDPSYSCDAELDDENMSEKRYLHHRSFRSEKNQRTGDKFITLMKKVCCQLSPFRTHKYGETRIRTQFVPKTKIKSRNGERKNQDSP